MRKHLLRICFKHCQRERKRHSANKPIQPAGMFADNVPSWAGVRNVAGKFEIFSVILFRGRFLRKVTKKSRNVNKLVGYNYRLTHSVSELSEFACTSSLSKRRNFNIARGFASCGVENFELIVCERVKVNPVNSRVTNVLTFLLFKLNTLHKETLH